MSREARVRLDVSREQRITELPDIMTLTNAFIANISANGNREVVVVSVPEDRREELVTRAISQGLSVG